MKKIKNVLWVNLIIVFFLFTSCCDVLSLFRASSTKSVSILSYNVQTFFDATTCGTEYQEYLSSSSKWSKAKYEKRLEILSGVIQDTCSNGPDIVVLQEIENANVLYDIASRFSYRNRYPYGIVAPCQGQALTIGVLSRFEISDFYVHQIYNENTIDENGNNTILRPLLEVHIKINDRELVLLCCHWKSQKNGDGSDKILRVLQAKTAIDRINKLLLKNPEQEILLVGDFNESINDNNTMQLYSLNEILNIEKPILISNDKSIMTSENEFLFQNDEVFKNILLYDPWFSLPKQQRGSYFYQDEWDCIDHILCSKSLFDSKGLEFSSFYQAAPDYVLKENGSPLRYDVYSGNGFSDHLPILTFLSVL